MRRGWIVIGVLAIAGTACSSGTPSGSGSSPSPTDTTTDGDSADFASQLASGFEGDFKIRFRITGTDQDTSEITWAQQGERSSYLLAGEGDYTLMIDDGSGEGTIFCSGDSCVRYGDSDVNPGEAILAPLFAFREGLEDVEDLPGFVSTGEATIAGRAASCASWDYLGTGSYEVCADDELGFLLKWSIEGGGQSFAWEAIEYTEPEDADFEPSGEVQDIPTGLPSS